MSSFLNLSIKSTVILNFAKISTLNLDMNLVTKY